MLNRNNIDASFCGSKAYILACPKCGGDNLHHNSVAVYERDEDNLITTVAELGNNQVHIHQKPSILSGNPSPRRDGVVIGFSCENCDISFELAIIQHKGTTFFEWLPHA